MSGPPVDADTIRVLAALLQDTGLTEIEVAEGDKRIRVVRAPATLQATAMAPAAAGLHGAAAATSLPSEITDYAHHPGAVKSPMVGVAYLAPEPGAPAFVTVGQTVQTGQTLMLIEAMKTFNQIKAPRTGMLSRILVNSGVPVEYGEVLMVID